MEDLKKGIYRHYKGGKYQVLQIVKNEEDKSDMVLYQNVDDESKKWVRSKKVFQEEVEVKGEKKPRFEFVE